MSLKLTYTSSGGAVEMTGGAELPASGIPQLRIKEITGLGLAETECRTVSYAGCDGQETVSKRALPRSITISADICAASAAAELRKTVAALCEPGRLLIEDGEMRRRIYCNHTELPDAELILRGRIAAFAVQFVCDSPFFEDADEISAALYTRSRELRTSFTLPRMFGKITTGAALNIKSRRSVEPVIRIYTPVSTTGAETVTITNTTTGKYIKLTTALTAGDVITIDIKQRTVTSAKSGNIVHKLSDETALGDLWLAGGTNRITAAVGSVSSQVTAECLYSSLYNEAMIL